MSEKKLQAFRSDVDGKLYHLSPGSRIRFKQPEGYKTDHLKRRGMTSLGFGKGCKGKVLSVRQLDRLESFDFKQQYSVLDFGPGQWVLVELDGEGYFNPEIMKNSVGQPKPVGLYPSYNIKPTSAVSEFV